MNQPRTLTSRIAVEACCSADIRICINGDDDLMSIMSEGTFFRMYDCDSYAVKRTANDRQIREINEPTPN